MTAFVFANNVNTTLAAALTSTSTTLSLSSSAGLPTLATGQVMPLTLNDAATGQVYEIVYVTVISGSNVTVERAQEGTGAQAWNTGDYVRCSPTAGTVAALNGSASEAFASSNIETSVASSTTNLFLRAGGSGQVYLESPTYTASVNQSNTGYVEHYVGNATAVEAAVPLGQAQAVFAAINGSASEAFNVSSLTAATGNITANGGKVRASVGAYNSGDNNAATILSDFAQSLATTGYCRLPNGLIFQWGVSGTPSSGVIAVFFPIVFPNALFSIAVSITGSSVFNNNRVLVEDSGTNAFYAYTGNAGGAAGGISFYWMAIGN